MSKEKIYSIESNVLDLHHFKTNEIGDLINEFIWACSDQKFREGIIIHGKGTGALRELVNQILEQDCRVASFHLDGANWGKTIFHLQGNYLLH